MVLDKNLLHVEGLGQEFHHEHSHQNSIISGVFYISTERGDNIVFSDPNMKIKHQMSFIPKEFNAYNSLTWDCLVENNVLMLFPSWLNHKVVSNKKATTDRISLSFNVVVEWTNDTY